MPVSFPLVGYSSGEEFRILSPISIFVKPAISLVFSRVVTTKSAKVHCTKNVQREENVNPKPLNGSRNTAMGIRGHDTKSPSRFQS
jgi:hypothetical protein